MPLPGSRSRRPPDSWPRSTTCRASQRHLFSFPDRYGKAAQLLLSSNIRTFVTTSVGRLFDTAAALTGFTREISFEGQAAMWLEHLARSAPPVKPYPFPFEGGQLDFRPPLRFMVRDRLCGREPREIARAFHQGVAVGLRDALAEICRAHGVDTVVLSGGVFQNELLMEDLRLLLANEALQVRTNHAVPPNDGGISLGQAAMAAIFEARGIQ